MKLLTAITFASAAWFGVNWYCAGCVDLPGLAAINDVDSMRWVLGWRSDRVNLAGAGGWASLPAAADLGSKEALEILLEHGANVDGRGGNRAGDTALHCAARRGHAAVVAKLLGAGADANARDQDGDTPLQVAARFGHLECASLLLAGGTKLECRNIYGMTALHCATFVPDSLGVLRLLLDNGALPSARDRDGQTPLHTAATSCNGAAVKALLERGAAVDALDAASCTALHSAIGWRGAPTVETLIAGGADVNIPAENGITPLHRAAALGLADVAVLLLNAGADVNARTAHPTGLRPVDLATARAVIELLQKQAGPVLPAHPFAEKDEKLVTPAPVEPR